jgi:hypothetical protein
MTPKTEMILDINHEIELKRLNPEHLSKLLEKELEIIDSTFYNSFSKILMYRKKYNDWKKYISEPGKQMDTINKKVARVLVLESEILKRIEKNKDYSKQEREVNEIVNYLEANEVDFSGLSNESFKNLDNLILDREKLMTTNKIGGIANYGLLNNEFFKTFISLLVFTISFLLSFWVGNFIEEKIKELGPVISKLIPAILFFLVIDKYVNKIETSLTWKRVEYLNKKHNESVLNINQQTIILTELEKKLGMNNH